MKRVVPGLVVVGLLVSGCSSDPTASEEYEELEDQLAAAQQQLAEVTVERDDLAGQLAAEIDRPFDLSLIHI